MGRLTQLGTLALTLVLFLPFARAEERVEFVFAYDTQQGFPAFMGDGQAVPIRYPGTYIDILRMVEQRLPIKLTLIRLPWERCKAYLARNLASGINSSYKPSRARMGVFPKTETGDVDRTRRITSDTYRFYTRTDVNLRYDPLKFRVMPDDALLAAPLGYSVVDDLKRTGLVVEQHPEGIPGILKLLFHGRVQGIIAHESQMRFTLGNNVQYAEVIVPVEPAIKEKDYFILISRGFYDQHPELSEQIWNEIAELREMLLPQLEQEYQSRFGS
ncbi:MAG: hypothetical protein R3183_06795 [Oleiphilaceae bacterium]|nr:hypothetical protein [Oleiphilaceae bacterium]